MRTSGICATDGLTHMIGLIGADIEAWVATCRGTLGTCEGRRWVASPAAIVGVAM